MERGGVPAGRHGLRGDDRKGNAAQEAPQRADDVVHGRRSVSLAAGTAPLVPIAGGTYDWSRGACTVEGS